MKIGKCESPRSDKNSARAIQNQDLPAEDFNETKAKA